ncbi:HEAT repeat domain-containing protein [Streptomyces sp. enrichment culture]|uniref:HEAT repeat domain-containing protein n=1 Tax=Streptomyces sp. enrichment culture TaxID=1795815 RepID=UPI003F5448CB
MFRGIDEVDWASLRHADGSAEDVPGLLRGLASADPAERETALDGMYGAVHHRGDVYDATLACVPFLLALAVREEVRDRAGVVELLVSIGGADGASPGLAAQVRAALRARAEVFVRLAGDADTGVRRAVLPALVRYVVPPTRALALLRERIAVERDDGVLVGLAEALGLFARWYGAAGDPRAAGAVRVLTELSRPPYGPGLRLAAVGQLAACAPRELPEDLVPTVVRLLRDRSTQRTRAGRAHGCSGTDTLAVRLRRLRPSDEEGSRLLRTLHHGLGDRVADRVGLLCGQLTSPDPLDRCNAVWMAAGLFREWRGAHPEPVVLIGAQVGAEEGRLHDAAVAVLLELAELAAPAAGPLHALVVQRPELRVHYGRRGTPALGGPLRALAGTGDARAVPVLAEVLAGPVVPDDLGLVIPRLGQAAAPLVPALRRRLARVLRDGPGDRVRAVPLLTALSALGDTASVPSVVRLLRDTPGRPDRPVVEAAVRALAAFGAAAREAIPELRGLLDTECSVTAAEALWSVTGEPDAVLPALLRVLTDTGSGRHHRAAAANALARLGPAAAPALPELLRLTGSAEPGERVSAACAVWRVAGDGERVSPVLRPAWAEQPRTRAAIAGCVAALGPAGTPLHDLLRTELAAPRRHRTDAGGQGIQADLALLRVCREALAGATPNREGLVP